jgi:25S rRNA (uracil2843-N3)-methyltransferase
MQTDHLITTLQAVLAKANASGGNKDCIRDIKDKFIERAYMDIFTNPDYLNSYFAHYTPSRALAYFALFTDIPELREMWTGRRDLLRWELRRRRCLRQGAEVAEMVKSRETKVWAIGAGAGAEILALNAAISNDFMDDQERWPQNPEDMSSVVFSDLESKVCGWHRCGVTMHVVDIGAWQPIINAINEQTCSDTFWRLQYSQMDVLSLSQGEVVSQASTSNLITCMFVLNELFKTSKAKTAAFLTAMIKSMRPDTLLLVVESAGSFSELQVGSKDVMVFQLLDRIPSLECVHRSDARWYRVPQSVQEQLPNLSWQNMRYFVRLFSKR